MWSDESRFGGTASLAKLMAPVAAGGYGLGDEALAMREKCVASPLFLAATVLSTLWDRNLLATPSEAHRLVEQAMIDQADTLYVDARGTAKTTLLVETGTISQGLRFPNDSQLLTHSAMPNAQGLSRSVRAHPQRNPDFRALFPDYAQDGDDGNVNSWSWACRTLGGREASVEAATLGTSMAGRHYHVIRCSDWMNEQTTPLYGLGTLEQMNNIVALFSQVHGLLKGKDVSPRVHFTCDSNRWHDADMAGTIIRRDTANTVRKIIRGVTGESGAFRSSWPEVKTPQMIQDIYDSPTMTAAMFAANFRSDPLPEGGMAFKREWFEHYDKVPKGIKLAIVVDPAFSDSKSDAKKTDRTGIVVSGFAPNGDFYVTDIAAGRWSPDEFVGKVFGYADFWLAYDPLLWLGIEDTGAARGLISMLDLEFRRTRRAIFVRKLKPAGKRKDQRIFKLHQLAENQHIFVRPDHQMLVDELLRFGVAEHDDLADALAYRVMEHYWGDVVARETAAPLRTIPSARDDTADGFLKRMHRTRRAGG